MESSAELLEKQEGPEGLFTKRNTSYKVKLAKMNMPEIPNLNKENS